MNLFKPKKKIELELARSREQAFRRSATVVDSIRSRISKLKKERDAAWRDARDYSKVGQQGVARRSLNSYRSAEYLIAQLEIKKWTYETNTAKLEMAKIDQDLANSLAAMNSACQIDPETVSEVLAETDSKLNENAASQNIWERAYNKHMEGLAETNEIIPTVEQLEAQLSAEIAIDLGARVPNSATETNNPQKNSEDLRQRARTILEDK